MHPLRAYPDRLGRALAGFRARFGVVVLFSCIINMLMMASSLYTMQLYDRVLASRSEATLIFLTGLVLAALLLYAALDGLRLMILARLGAWLDAGLGPDLLARSVQAALMSRQPSTRALRDLGELRSVLTGPALQAVLDVPWMPVFLAVVWLVSPPLAWVALLGGAVLVLLALLNEAALRGPVRESEEASAQASHWASATVRNSEVVAAMGMMPAVVGRWEALQSGGIRPMLRMGTRGGWFAAASRMARQAIQILVMAVGAWYVLRHELTGGAMIAGSILVGRMLAPVDGAIGTWRQLVQGRAAYRRLGAFYAGSEGQRLGLRLPDPEPKLEARGLRYAYPGMMEPVLRGVSLSARPGQAVAILGPSASGKSTLARLLTGVYEPAAGEVRLDGAELRQWDPAELGRHLGYLPQDVELFPGSVAENIARFTAAPVEAVIEAAKAAGAHEMILALPQGYETQVGESGAMLSGGQRQRIGLARALFGSPRLIVLDEPNSNLDHEGEQALLRAIEAVKARGGTVLFIAHRPTLLACADRVVLLRHGLVEADGERDEVMKRLARPRQVHPAPAAPPMRPATAPKEAASL